MEKFIECIRSMYCENYLTLVQQIAAQEIPCACFSTAPVETALEIAANLKNDFNIRFLLTINPIPSSIEENDIKVVDLQNFEFVKNYVRYIFALHTVDYKIASIPLTEGVKKILLVDSTDAQKSYEVFMRNISELYKVYTLLEDEESKQAFCGYLLAKVTNNLNYAKFASTPQYICDGFAPQAGDILIDGGACDGNTALRFHGYGCKVYSFEMDAENFKLASALAKQNNFIVENLGLGSYNHTAQYTQIQGNIGGSHLSKSGESFTEIVTLDSYVARQNLPRVDFIKLDVEGAELDVLRGAAASIVRWKPRLAISAYHKLDDLWKLTSFINSLRPDYKFAIRHYGTSREDAPYGISAQLENLFDMFNLDVTAINHGELVLLGR